MSHQEVIAKLAECRTVIDSIDVRLVSLLNERTRVVERIGHLKQGAAMPVYEPKREDEVFANITRVNDGPLPAEALRRIFERIIDEMRTVQRERMLREKETN